MYSELLHDPKVQRLSPRLFKHWINLLCIACEAEEQGRLPTDEDVAYALRVSEADWLNLSQALVDAGLLDTKLNGLEVHGWKDRQFESDDSTARAKAWRERTRQERYSERSRNVARNVIVTAQETDTEQRQKQNRTEAEEEADVFNIFRLGEQFYGRPLGTMEIKTLERIEEEYEPDCIEHSFQEASDQNKKSFKYAEAIMKGHKERGCFVDRRTGATAQSNGVLEPVGLRLGSYEPPGFVLDP